MEIIRQIKNSIKYMEEHLREDIQLSDIASHVYMSSFNFHRTFKILTGVTPTEYIRNRRLSNAGEDLLNTSTSVLDLAMKYCYDSLEGFSKAFSRFHGASPSQVRKEHAKIKTYHPLKINISFEGGEGMDYKVVALEPFTLLGKGREFRIDSEENMIPAFWKEETRDGLLEELKKHSIETGVYGACFQEDQKSKTFKYSISMKVKRGTSVKNLESINIDNPLWAVFECENVNHIEEVWNYILKEFLVNTDYERVEVLDFELYSRTDIFCELYIPIRKLS